MGKFLKNQTIHKNCQRISCTSTQDFLFQRRDPAFLTLWSFPRFFFPLENGLVVKQSHSIFSNIQFINIPTGFMIKALESVSFHIFLSIYSNPFTNSMCYIFSRDLSVFFPLNLKREGMDISVYNGFRLTS